MASHSLVREFCAENATDVPAAIAHGAKRIELCDNLAVGGTTPSLGVIEAVSEYAHPRKCDVMVMIRPRGGNYTYTDWEVQMMLKDIAAILALKTPITGFVLGALRNEAVDKQVIATLLAPIKQAKHHYELTFHMAFDELAVSEQIHAMTWLIDQGFTRILTHGGTMRESIDTNLPHLQHLIKQADGRITILPGGGITYQNALMVAQALGVQEVHGTKIVSLDE